MSRIQSHKMTTVLIRAPYIYWDNNLVYCNNALVYYGLEIILNNVLMISK